MMKRRALWLMVSCLMAASLVLASCAPPEGEKAAPAEEKDPQYGGTLTILTTFCDLEHLSFDHADVQWMHNYTAGPYQETLLVGDLQKGPRGTGEWSFTSMAYIPEGVTTGCLAESWEWTDPSTLVFHIRQGVMWQDKPGVMEARELTADDVVSSWDRILAKPAFVPGRYDWIDSFSAPDKYTVVVKANEFNANWPYRLGWGYYTMICPPELAEAGARDWENACGTGPFMLTDYIKGTCTTYERNPDYWGTTTIDGKEYQLPFVDKMVWPIIADESTQLAALRTAQVDVAEEVAWHYAESLEETTPELQRWQPEGELQNAIGMRADTPPFDDIRVRQALNMAVDRQGMIESLMGGHAILLNFPFCADWELYTPIDELPESAQELFTYNSEKAKALLAEAGYPEGFKCEMVCNNLQASIDMASMVASNLADVGVEVELKPLEYGAYLGTMYSKRYEHMYLTHFGTGNPFSRIRETMLSGQNWNTALWDDSSVDEKWYQARREMDVSERNRLLKELCVYAIDQCPYIMLPTAHYYRYAWPWVRNYYGENRAGAVNPSPIYGRIWLDLEQKAAMGY